MLEVSWIMIVMMTAKRLMEDIDNLDEVDLNIADGVMLRRRAAVYSFSSVDDDNKSVPTTTTTTTS